MRNLKTTLALAAVFFISVKPLSAQDQDPGDWAPGQEVASDPCIQLATTWFLGGNNIIAPAGASPLGTSLGSPPPHTAQTDIGTCNNFPFILKANNFRSVFIQPSGYIGINNANPLAPLDIKSPTPGQPGNVRFFCDLLNTVQSTGHFNLVYGAGADFIISEGTPFTSALADHFTIHQGNVGIDEPAPIEKLQVNGNTRITGNLGVGAYPAAEKLHVAGGNLRVDGNAGIGVATALERLHVGNGNLRVDGHAGVNCAPGAADLQIADAGDASVVLTGGINHTAKFTVANNWLSYDYGINAGAVGCISQATTNLISFQTLWAGGGAYVPQVWIGKKPTTSHQSFQFAVSGEMVAKSIYVTVNCGWADYVFAPDYKLPKLEDVESYYKANRHLPEIPTAKDVEDNGVDVGEMNRLLLKKVEELTLYVVQQQKEIDRIKKDIAK